MRESAFHSKWAPAPNPWAGGLVPAARANGGECYTRRAPVAVRSLSSNARADLNCKYILRAGEKMSGVATGLIYKIALASNVRLGDRS
jgi:hypothetical protein